jgi:hypothetical protein
MQLIYDFQSTESCNRISVEVTCQTTRPSCLYYVVCLSPRYYNRCSGDDGDGGGGGSGGASGYDIFGETELGARSKVAVRRAAPLGDARGDVPK